MTDEQIVAAIRVIRAKNNDPWMEIVLIALRNDRPATIEQLTQIVGNDLAVSSLVCEITDPET